MRTNKAFTCLIVVVYYQDQEIVETVKKQRVIGYFNSSGGAYSIPEDSFSKSIHKGRFSFNEKQVKIVDRGISKKLQDFISSSARDCKRGVYIQGPQGFGKSHSIYQAVYLLRLKPKNIVIYIPDCQGWAESNNAYSFLISSMVHAASFAQDSTLSNFLCSQTIPQSLASLKELITQATKLWLDAEHQVYWVFDQHNGLTDSQRKESPYCIIESYLAGAMETFGQMVVVSASANNNYYFTVAHKESWPVFQFCDGFTKEECLAYLGIHNVIVSEDDLETVNLYTNFIPSVVAMALKIPIEPPHFINQQLMFVKDKHVYGITKVVESILEERYMGSVVNSLEFTEDLRGRVVEKYIIDSIIEAKAFKISCSKMFYNIDYKKEENVTKLLSTGMDWQGLEAQKLKTDKLKAYRWGSPYNEIIVPSASNFPHVDFFLWTDLSSLMLPPGTKTNFLWIADRRLNVNKESFNNQFIVYLDEITNNNNNLKLLDFFVSKSE
ncbi:hypothetical protein DFA_06757 [Cavenderia fasciculata]|uniref:Uncharacterized protein n=1 Tax=Cavenderia fasciculata TaxID=261658 RepID=F4Q270_CACFS|nr:uncharacterized protein DFA_06757 [Cavenderia fasciculata]EGG18090.1 hypothetical protein DFA_06757 [Cavenderia fasciculata]|eukprot:XP_004366131.1 hypothetical protein DFA_06757 [Cavenderia fasciculata]